MLRDLGAKLLLVASAVSLASAAYNRSVNVDYSLLQSQAAWSLDNRPPECPPCFNCLLPAFSCKQFAGCSSHDGKCECPPGFGGDNCLQPLCGSLAEDNHRPAKGEEPCECDEGWTGINCNVCETDNACDALMPNGEGGGVCYKQGIAVKHNYQQCDVTNRKILEMLKRNPQVTFGCDKAKEECTFQFWVDQVESFYCALDDCNWELQSTHDKNVTEYECKTVKCECIPGRTLCGEGGTIDLTEFLTEGITGPATFSCDSSKEKDSCYFSEPAMNDVISSIFGDESILLDCNAGECLHKSEVPGYTRPVKTINKPLIAGVIAGCALFIVAVILGLWYLGRRSNQRNGLGAIQLPDDDEASRLGVEHKPAALQFEKISYSLQEKNILKDVTGVVNSGQVMAIMGPSGAGKTTFLDILARKNKRGMVQGNIYVNGSLVSDEEYREVIGFVDQEDTMMPTLTVYETILNSALLRLPRDMPFQAKDIRVMEVMAQLGILAIKDQIIGTSEDNGLRGISGGEKRRVGIACELVTSPSILFLDEPTSGLDSYNAYNVVECLVNLARNYRRTVVFTIHQPKSNIVALFDQLVLLAKGRCVYSGPFDKCQRYFDQQGYPCPQGFNIADYLVDLTMHADSRRALPQEEDAVAESVESPRRRAVVSPSPSESTSIEPRKKGRKRGDSIRARQERQLFTRRRSEVASPVGEEVMMSDDLEGTRAWRDASEQRHSLDETEHLLPPAPPMNGSDATDLDVLIAAYKGSDVAAAISEEIQAAGRIESNGNANGSTGQRPANSGMKGFRRIGWLAQFVILSRRTWKNLYRNPMLMLAHYAISILLGVLCGYLFFGLKDDISGFQNRMGLIFFILALFGFSTLTSLNVFAAERTLFLRERANRYYAPITYFSAKVMFDIVPLRIIPPIIMGMIIYPMVGFYAEWPEFLKFMLVLVLFNLAASAICLFIGIIFKDTSLANLVGSLVMLFSLLFAGLLLNHDSIPKGARWLQTCSIFHYGFEALIVNEVRYLSLYEHKYGLDIEVPGATILSTFGFNSLAYWTDVIGLGVFAGGFIVLAYGAMHLLLVEKR